MTNETRILRVPHVVIVGGGFGGLSAAHALRKAPVSATLVDRRNHHVFQPLLYQVATAMLSPADIAGPIRSVLRHDRATEVRMSEVTGFDLPNRQVLLADGTGLAYDYLVVATGATHAYFGHPEWEPLAPGLKTIEDATHIRRRFLLAFEAAEQEEDPEERRALLTFVVVGAGPTGVEMAGAFAEIARKSLVRDFRRVDTSTARVILLEGGPRVLSAYDEDLGAYARRSLERKGVDVRTGSVVTRIEADAVYVGEERIRTRNVVWAAGVTASPLGRALGVETDRVGRVMVQPDLSIPGHPEVFVVGDLMNLAGPDGTPYPGVAQVAIQGGQQVARNIARDIKGQPRRPFKYFNKGNMATIGRRSAILQRYGFKMKGIPAWMAWLFVHIMFLIGYRNRLAVLLQWAWSYFTWQRGARLITGDVGADLAPPGKPLGTLEHASLPPSEGSPMSRDVQQAHDQGQTVPAEPEGGWMGGDRSQARRG
ncbi:NAD(P)/FAD-dependent oxidoreductase [Longimicrobium sp.]|uniref:NAD(P)/FAD-dependent oxidoreductase n=1 Tax=Longimicrobium sp. TaxID=2029185 RepID=UPI002E32661A|nr:NAD(P)/FAD-dependent oxidoreductase [Longimicrobium sp.]HEX6041940.1 NAD(P)/FAD-dependent oxidoreductase [Longimicrobium sp.]